MRSRPYVVYNQSIIYSQSNRIKGVSKHNTCTLNSLRRNHSLGLKAQLAISIPHPIIHLLPPYSLPTLRVELVDTNFHILPYLQRDLLAHARPVRRGIDVLQALALRNPVSISAAPGASVRVVRRDLDALQAGDVCAQPRG